MRRDERCGLVFLVVVASCLPVLGQNAAAGSRAGDVFAAAPADAWGVLRIRNVGELDRQIVTMAQRFGAPPMSPLMLAKGFLGLLSGVDDSGDLLLVAMPADSTQALEQSTAVFVPTTSFAELTSLMELQEAEGGVSKVVIQGTEIFIGPKGKYAVLGKHAESVKAILDAKEGLAGKLTPHQLKRSDEDQITFWLNAEALVASPAIAPMIGMLQMFGVDTSVLTSLKTLQVGLQLDPTGIRLGVCFEMKAGTDLAKVAADTKDTTKSLLTGLAREDYVLALGMLMTQAGCDNMAASISRLLSSPQVASAPLDPEKLTELRDLLVRMIHPTRSGAIVVSAMPAGFDGMIGFTKVVTVDGDAKESLARMGEFVALIKGGLFVDEEVNKKLEHLEYKTGAETVNGISVDHLTFNLDGIEGASPEWLESLKTIVGKDGLLFRIGAVDDRHVVATFGGGAVWMASAIELVKADKAPLADDPGIQRVAGVLNRTRSLEGYVAVDRLVKLVASIAEAAGSPTPVSMPEINAPIGFVASKAGETGAQVDVFFPTEAVMAVKDAIQAAKMAGAQPAPATMPAPTPTTAPVAPEQ